MDYRAGEFYFDDNILEEAEKDDENLSNYFFHWISFFFLY